ncbi:hypothetical protein AKJ60_00745 [candidate division MSBL1 archaeon SCGC-AAA385M11]|nr:hypothetical protein AKJ60_00745 [candidate division MSBL1 archaeon SCGC-AAA385M11]
MKRIYLDVCALCRPYDDQSYTRIHLETTAVQLILRAIERGDYELFYSPVHETEISAISNYQERVDLLYLLKEIGRKIFPSGKNGHRRAEYLVDAGLGVADAAHIAYAEHAGAVFMSCDDKLIKKCNRLDITIWTTNPVMFCDKEGIQ